MVAEAPKIGPFIPQMRTTLAGVLGLAGTRVNIKGTTAKGMGAVGAGEGIATFAEGLGGLGRTHAADVATVMQAQRVAGRLPHLDQLAGGLAAWPAGWGAYFYGAGEPVTMPVEE